MEKKVKILSDFDSTIIVQNSLNVLAWNGIKYFLKKRHIGQLIRKSPIFWIRLREVYKSKKFMPKVYIFDDTDLVVKKSKNLKYLPFSVYSKHTVPFLDINKRWIKECLRLQRKYKLVGKKITIVSRNGVDEINEFLNAYANENNLNLVRSKSFVTDINIRFGLKKKPQTKKKIKNKDIFKFFGIKFDIIANKLCKKQIVEDDHKDLMYTGVVHKTHKLGIIESRNKAILYEGNVVLADKEEKMYKNWAKEFVCVQRIRK